MRGVIWHDFILNLVSTIGFDSSDEEITKSAADLKRQTWIVLRKKVDEELADNLLLLKLRNRYASLCRISCVVYVCTDSVTMLIDSRKSFDMMKRDYQRFGSQKMILILILRKLEMR